MSCKFTVWAAAPGGSAAPVGEALPLPWGPLLDVQTLLTAGRLLGGDGREAVPAPFKGSLLFLQAFEGTFRGSGGNIRPDYFMLKASVSGFFLSANHHPIFHTGRATFRDLVAPGSFCPEVGFSVASAQHPDGGCGRSAITPHPHPLLPTLSPLKDLGLWARLSGSSL